MEYWESSDTVKLNTHIPHGPAIPLLVINVREMKWNEIHESAYIQTWTDIHRSTIYNRGKLEIPHMTITTRMVKSIVIYSHMEYYSNKNIWRATTCNDVDESHILLSKEVRYKSVHYMK